MEIELDNKARQEQENLKNKKNVYYIDSHKNKKLVLFNDKNKIELYSKVNCVNMVENKYYIIDAIYFHENLTDGLISNRNIQPMVFKNISGKYCRFISHYNKITDFRKNKYYFFQTIEQEKKDIVKRNNERKYMRLILNRRCCLGSIEICKLVNEFL